MNRKTSLSNPSICSLPPVLALCISTALGLSAPAVLAQETATTPNATATTGVRTYNIPAQPLSEALIQFEQQSGLQVTTHSGLVKGKQASAVKGSLSAQQALSQLLAGTGLYYQISGGVVSLSANNGGAITSSADKGGAIVLPPVKVTASSIQESAYGPVNGYLAKRSATATKTDTPIIDIPASIQVVPREVIEDQGAIRIADVLKNVSGVSAADTIGNSVQTFTIRGFRTTRIAKDGFLPLPSSSNATSIGLANIERVEVLKGPASILYGQVIPGGLINLVTKKPQPEPFYHFSARYGSYDLYRGQIDLNQPLNSSNTLLFRLNGSYLNDGSFRDYFMDSQQLLIAPSLRWALSDRTTVDLQYEYARQEQQWDRGLVVVNGDPLALPIDRYLGEPDDHSKVKRHRAQLTLDHAFNEAWRLRLLARYADIEDNPIQSWFDGLQSDGRTLNRRYFNFYIDQLNYGAQANLTGHFRALWMDHQLLIGLNANRSNYDSTSFSGDLAPIDIFNPVYGAQPSSISAPTLQDRHIYNYGFYLQDLISVSEHWKVLLGGRFDVVETFFKLKGSPPLADKTNHAFSPRVGLVYQPIDDLSLYASYSESFDPPLLGRSADGKAFEPLEGTQYEVGLKRYFLDGKLSTTLALFHITQENVATADPANPNSSIQVGEQRSRGVELSIAGELYTGWNVIGSATYLDAEITEDNTFAVGNELPNVPHWQGSLWSTYRFQSVPGLEIGGGVFYVGARQADLDNSVELDGYTRVDLLARYRINKHFALSLNINNVLDKEYIRGAQSNLTVEPGAPRTAFLRLDTNF